ncbi:type IV secretion system protein [Paremcibacter congregatus]|uniref:type IV secretion system protein n=1 Tax=Paremcibacter congregatus TaxID=2043170 RepID=UPI003A8CE9F3
MDSTILSDTLNTFLAIVQNNYAVFHIWAMRLFYLLVTLDIIITIVLPLVKGQSWVSGLVRRVVIILVLFTFINNYDYWVNMVVNGGVAAGIKASTGQDLSGPKSIEVLNVLKSPSLILEMPSKMLGKMWSSMSGFDPGGAIMLVLIGLIMYLSFAIVTLTVIVTYLEFAFAATLSLILLPFAALKQTAFIGEKVFSLVVSYAVRLMTLAFIIGIGNAIFKKTGTDFFVSYSGWEDGMVMALVGILYLMLAMSIPKMAAGLFSGSPSLGAGDAAMAGGGAALAGLGLGVAGIGTAKGAALLAGQSTKAASVAGGFAKGAFQAGKMASGGSLGPGSGMRGTMQGLKGVGRATGRAARETTTSLKNRITAPLRNAHESARYSGNMATKAPPVRASRGRPLTPGEAFSQKQNTRSGANVLKSLRTGGHTAGRGGFQTANSSTAPLTPSTHTLARDDDE